MKKQVDFRGAFRHVRHQPRPKLQLAALNAERLFGMVGFESYLGSHSYGPRRRWSNENRFEAE